MERKAFNSLNEAALQVQLNESDSEKPEQKPKEKSAKPKYKVVHNYTKGGKMSTQYVKAHVEYDEVDAMVLEYFNNYFGDNLNEDTSDEDIMDAVYDLIDLTEAVLDVVQLDEKGVKRAIKQFQHGAVKPAANLALVQGKTVKGKDGLYRDTTAFNPLTSGELEGKAGRKAIARMKSAQAKIKYKDRTSGERHRNWTAGIEKDVVAGKLTGQQGKEKIDRSIRTRVSPETVSATQGWILKQQPNSALPRNKNKNLEPDKDYIRSAHVKRSDERAKAIEASD